MNEYCWESVEKYGAAEILWKFIYFVGRKSKLINSKISSRKVYSHDVLRATESPLAHGLRPKIPPSGMGITPARAVTETIQAISNLEIVH